MRRIFTLMMICALILMTGCGSGDGDKKSGSDGEIKLGTIKQLNVTEVLLDDYFEKASSRIAQNSRVSKPSHIFFDNMSTMVAALQSGQIDALSTYQIVAKYLTAQNPDFTVVTEGVPKVSDSFCCAIRKEDTALQKEFNDAILELTKDGKLQRLVKDYVNDVDTSNLSATTMPHFDGADTIKIAVTGDLPPLDYISADGTPAGFNTAVLSAISQLVGKNFELVDIDSGARAAALTSGQVEVVFWVVVPENGGVIPSNFDTPDGVIVTEPYFTNEIVHVQMKK